MSPRPGPARDVGARSAVRISSPAVSRRPALVPALAALVVLAGCAADVAPAPARTVGPPPAETLLVIGDSYAAGQGADSARSSFAWELGQDLGLSTTVDGVAGTGFVNPGPGPADQTYLARLATLPADELTADLVVVQGGLNDRQHPGPEVASAAGTFLAELATRAPGATIVLVGAPAPDPDQPAASAAVNSALSRAARQQDVEFVDPTAERWFTDDNVSRYVTSDQVHPTQQGHDYLARRLAEVITPLITG